MQNPIDFSGKNVFVAGGTSGINLGVAEGFARAGAALAVLSRSQDKVDAAVAHLSSFGGDCVGAAGDVRDYEAVEGAFRKAESELGAIDVLVSGAAGNFPATALGMSPNGFRAVAESVPLKRMGAAEDVANLAMALASPLGAYVNGAVIPVDGGWSLTGLGEMMGRLADSYRESQPR